MQLFFRYFGANQLSLSNPSISKINTIIPKKSKGATVAPTLVQECLEGTENPKIAIKSGRNWARKPHLGTIMVLMGRNRFGGVIGFIGGVIGFIGGVSDFNWSVIDFNGDVIGLNGGNCDFI